MRLAGTRVRKSVLVAFVVVVVLASIAPAAGGQATGGRLQRDRRISLSGGLVIAADEVVQGPVVSFDGPVTINGVVDDDVFVGHGNLRINGRITGDVLVADGDVTVNGRVGGDVVAVLGRVTTRDSAHVSGDVVSRRPPDIASGTVDGEVKRLNVSSLLRGFLVAFLVFLWISVTVSIAIIGLLFVLLFPRAADATALAGRRVWASFGWGALVGIVGPILAVLVLVTVIGLPLGFGMLSALNILSSLGYVVACLALGRTMVKGTTSGARIGAFFAGFGILRAAALIPGVGFVVWFVACLYGLGALTLAAWRAGHGDASQPVAPVETPSGAPPPSLEPPPAPAPEAPTSSDVSA